MVDMPAKPIPAGAGLNRCRPGLQRSPRADPRRRGAQPPSSPSMPSRSARSPQARGSTVRCPHWLLDSRPIPAGAGLNRMANGPHKPLPPDPRRRGAQPVAAIIEQAMWDRSPQARGSTASHGATESRLRPIPAGAGLNRDEPEGQHSLSSDPRRRGAQPVIGYCVEPPLGRSPQARGSTGAMSASATPIRPIPAGAGLNRRGRL